MVLVTALTLPMVAVAAPSLEEQLYDLLQQLNMERAQREALQNQVWQLQQQLEDAGNQNQQPAPVFEPQPRLLTPTSISIAPGETRDITVTVRNVGIHNALNFMSQAVPNGPFTVEFLNNSNLTNNIGENRQHNMTMRISVNENAQSGSHSIALTHHFRTQAQVNRTTTDTIAVQILGDDENLVAPNVRLGNFRRGDAGGTITPGQSFTVLADIQNISTANARDVQVSLPGISADNIFFTGDLNQAFFANMQSGHNSSLQFAFQASSRITSGTYPIEFEVSYRAEVGGPLITERFTFFVNVQAAEDENEANLEIRNMSAPSGRFEVGQTATISFYVHNTGQAEARNIRIEAAPESISAIVPVNTASRQTIASLAPGQSQRVSFSFSPREAAITRSYAIGFTVSHAGENFQQFAAINVYNPTQNEDGPGRVQVPRVIVSDTSLYPAIPRAGQEFTLTVTFRNTSSTRSVNNIRVLMEEIMGSNIPGQQSHFAGFAPQDDSNTLFLDYLAPLGEITMDLRFTTVTEATPGAHNMRFSFDYQDQDFNNHEASQQLSISVAQVTRLELANVNIASFASVGSPVWFEYRIINSGRVNLINVRTRTEGAFDVAQAGRFIGPINAQRTADFSGQFFPEEPGQQTGRFIVYGEDITGAIVELVHEFSIYVEGGFGGGGDRFGGDGGMFEGGGGIVVGGPGFGGGSDGERQYSYGWCPVANESVRVGYFDPETFMFVELGEWCMETGAFLPFSTGFNFLEFIRRPLILAIGGGVLLVAVIVIVVVVRKKSGSRFDNDDL